MRKKEERWSRNMYKGPMDKDNVGGEDLRCEVGVGRAGEINGEKVGTNVIEQL